MKMAVLTAVYPAAEPFLDEFQESLADQDDQDFRLYVLDDGLGDIRKRFAHFGTRLHPIPAQGTPGAIRSIGLHALAADGMELVMFADCDDVFSPNRLSVSRQALLTNNVIVNELIAFGADMEGHVPMLAPILSDGQLIHHDDLIHGNLIGLGNSACHIKALLPHVDAIDPELIAYDWALYTRVLRSGDSARFTALASTFYRQHSGSIAGLQGHDSRTIKRCVQVKASHYRALADCGQPYVDLADRFARVRDSIDTDPRFCAQYIAACAGIAHAPGAWWSAAILSSGASV